jgi:agmatinase
MHNAFRTFFGMPVALTPEDLKAGQIEVAIVGSTANMSAVLVTHWAPNFLRGFTDSSATYFAARGDWVQERNPSGFPMALYTMGSIHEVRIADYGNMAMHQSSGELTTEEMCSVLGEITATG